MTTKDKNKYLAGFIKWINNQPTVPDTEKTAKIDQLVSCMKNCNWTAPKLTEEFVLYRDVPHRFECLMILPPDIN